MRAFVLASFIPAVLWALQFTIEPTLTASGNAWQVEFAVDETTDVEVSIVNPADSTVVRHLAAGLLGAKAPAPLTAGTLHQSLSWDGKDDYGASVSNPGALEVRVRAGMSVAFHQSVGFNPYAWGKSPNWGCMMKGVAVDKARGVFFVYGTSGNLAQSALRAYDLSGTYLRTVYPYSGALQADQVRGFGVNLFSGNAGFVPKYSTMVFPEMEMTMMGTSVVVGMNHSAAGAWTFGTLLCSDVINDEIVVFDPTELSFIVLKTDGTVGASLTPLKLVMTPVIAGPFKGPMQIRLSPDGKWFYLTGLNAGGFGGGHYNNGTVFRVDRATGAASPLVELGTCVVAASEAAAQGVATDDSGRVFVCDRKHQRIGVYDTLGNLLDSLAVDNPYLVDLNRKTGELYVVTRVANGETGMLSVRKFASWHNGAAQTAYLPGLVNESRQAFLALADNGPKAALFVVSNGGGAANGVWFLRDDGGTLTQARDFNTETSLSNVGFDRIAVDRHTEVCYLNNSWSNMYKVADWRTPAVLPCTTSYGQRMTGGDFAISPSDELYVRTGDGYDGPISVYSQDHRHVHKRQAYPDNKGGKFGPGGYADRGFAVLPDGNMAVMEISPIAPWTTYWLVLVSPAGRILDTLVFPLMNQNGGVKWDLQGNLYVGAWIMGRDHEMPGSGFAGDHAYWHGTGSVVKFPRTGGSLSTTEMYGYQRTAAGALKIYPQDLGPYSGTPGSSTCSCRSPRFDLDPYGRLFIPSAFTSRVAVADNAGNNIARFGRYGNVDDPLENIPLAFPVGAAASEDYIYVSDMQNNRIMRLKMNYVLDNIPGLTEHGTAADRIDVGAPTRGAPTLSAAPNPFNPEVVLTMANGVPGRPSLKIFDPSGRLVADLSGRINAGRAVWNASGHSSGVYLAVAQTGNRKMTNRIILSR